MATFRFTGYSGEKYEYSLIDIGVIGNVSRQAGNFLFAAGSVLNPIPVFISDAPSIQQALYDLEPWRMAQKNHGAKFCYARINNNSTPMSREAERLDLVEQYRPPMNPTYDAE